MPPLRADSFRRRWTDSGQDQLAGPGVIVQGQNVPKPPPAPARALVNSTTGSNCNVQTSTLQGSSGFSQTSIRHRHQHPSVQPPVKAPPVPPPRRFFRFNTTAKHSTRSARSTERLHRHGERDLSLRQNRGTLLEKRPINVPEPPAPPSRMTGTQ